MKFTLKAALLLPLLFISSASFSQIKREDIKHYGYYVSLDDLYYPAKPSKLKYHFDLSRLGDMSSTPENSSGNTYQVLVYQEKWSVDDTSFYLYDLDLDVHRFDEKTIPTVKKLDNGRYLLSFDKLQDGQVLFASDATGLYCIGLGNLEKNVIELFRETKDTASLVVDRINKALKSFPDNKQLKSQLKGWERKSVLEKDIEVWKDVEGKFAKYETEKNIDTQAHHAKSAIREIKYYLSLGPNPKYKSLAIKMQKQIENQQEALISKIKNTKIDIPDQSELKEEVRYFSDGKGMEISLVDIGSKGDTLIRFSGIANKHNNIVYRYKKANQNTNTGAYIYQSREINGKNWNSFIVENGGWYGERVSVFPPGINKQTYVRSGMKNSADTALKIYRDYTARAEKHNQALK